MESGGKPADQKAVLAAPNRNALAAKAASNSPRPVRMRLSTPI